MKPFAFDTETGLIKFAEKAPPMVCVSFADIHNWNTNEIPETPDLTIGLLHHSEAEEHLKTWFTDPKLLMIGANTAYDAGVVMQRFPKLAPYVWDAYQEDRVQDIFLRQRLIDIAQGTYWALRKRKGVYSLKGLTKRYFDIDLDKGENTWRMRYIELIDKPIAEWPADAKTYAKDDAEATTLVWLEQEKHFAPLLEDSCRQARAGLWIHLMTAWGMRTDQRAVAKLARAVQRDYDELEKVLLAEGLLKRVGKEVVEIKRDTKAAKAVMVEVMTAQGKDISLTKGGQVALDKDSCEESGDIALEGYAELTHLKTLLGKDIKALSNPEVHPYCEVLLETGRTSMSSPNTQNPARTGGIRECYVPRPGTVLIDSDYDLIEMRTFAQVCLWTVGQSKLAEAINAGYDPHLSLGAQLIGLSYEEAVARKKDKEVKEARQSAKCFHPDTEVLTKTGWVKISELDPSQEVAAAIVEDEGLVEIRWEVPQRLTTRQASDGLVHMKTKGIDLRVTPDHRMSGFRKLKSGSLKASVFMPEDLGYARYWPSAGVLMNEAPVSVDLRLLKLAVATQADGSYNGPKIRFGFKKQRKVDRLRSFLNEDEYVQNTTSQGATAIVFNNTLSEQIKALLDDKKFPWWWLGLSAEARTLILDEAEFWDGSRSGNQVQYAFSSVKKQNVDVLQALASITGRKSRATNAGRQKEHHNEVWKVSVKRHHMTRGGELEPVRIPYEGPVYCLTVSTDCVLVRDGGIPVITHQCANFGFPGGMGATRFKDYAKYGYNVDLTLEQATLLRDVWLNTWPEARDYFKYVSDKKANEWYFDTDRRQDSCRVLQLVSNRWRAGCSYTESANTRFQGLAADLAKAAGFLIARESYDESLNSPLFGCRIVNFIHDQFLVETFEENAHECAKRVGLLMTEAAKPFLPDIPATCTPCLASCWSKGAEAVYNSSPEKRLMVWEPVFGTLDEASRAGDALATEVIQVTKTRHAAWFSSPAPTTPRPPRFSDLVKETGWEPPAKHG